MRIPVQSGSIEAIMTNNNDSNRRSIYVVFLPLIFIGLVLQIIRLPDLLENNRPDFIVLVLIYFSVLDNRQLSIEIAWITGLLLDLLSGAPLGINAFMMAAQVYLIVSQFTKFAAYRIWQQAIIICVINLLVNVIGYWIGHILGLNYSHSSYIIPSVMLFALWPLFYAVSTILCKAFLVIPKEKE